VRPALVDWPQVTTLLSIDGGNAQKNVHACYVAEFEAGHLYALHELNREQAVAARMAPDAVAFEAPNYLKAGVPPKIIFGLIRNVARVAEALAAGCPVFEYTVNDGVPTDWIGGVRKPVLHRRIWRMLKPEERRIFPASTEADIERAADHHARTKKILTSYAAFNTLDAAGVGLFHLGRIGKGGTRR
jgi:hypothetical protein